MLQHQLNSIGLSFKESVINSNILMEISVGARQSLLSQAQVKEVQIALNQYYPEIQFKPIWMVTTGDKDKHQSLLSLEKTDFFTKEIDQAQLRGKFRIAIHSAKDLPANLPLGLTVVALTKGLDPSDSIVYNNPIPYQGRVGTSSNRRIELIYQWREDLICLDIRGTIQERLFQLDQGYYDAILMAECALIRLKLNRKRIILKEKAAPLQGRLAIVAHESDQEMKALFQPLHYNEFYES